MGGPRGVNGFAVVLVLGLIMPFLAGCDQPAADLPVEWKGRDLRKPGWTNSTLATEWSLVLEYPLPSGAQLHWDFFTQDGAYAYFQVVRVEGKPVSLVGKHSEDDASSLTTPKAGVYQVVWMNDGYLPLNFTWSASEGYSQRTYPPGEGPGCVLLLRASSCALQIPPEAK